jgi:archaellum component FlaF (FlaF/FlaG flagellin family)
METAIASLICIALIVFGGMTMSNGFLTSVDASTTGLAQIGHRDETIMRTNLSSVSTNMSAVNTLEVTLENNGQTKIADFEKWDVIVQYHDGDGTYHTRWLPYTGGVLGDNQWKVAWIRFNGSAEVFDPNVLNPGEQIQIKAQLNPSAGDATTNMVVISTPNGIPVSTYFSP